MNWESRYRKAIRRFDILLDLQSTGRGVARVLCMVDRELSKCERALGLSRCAQIMRRMGVFKSNANMMGLVEKETRRREK